MSGVPEVQSTLDLAQIAPAHHQHAVLSAFDQLDAGERLILVAPYDPHPLLAALQIERWGRFEWSTLSEGPNVWRVELGRRTNGHGRRLSTAMEWDHERLAQLEAAAFEAREGGRFSTARVLAGWLVHGLRRHMRFEDDLLFPEYARRALGTSDADVVHALGAEHSRIELLLAELAEQISDPEAPVELLRRDLRHALADHERKETRIVYPALDSLLSADEAEELVARVQAWGPG